jgi:signal transduction histidine kinase
MSSRVFPSHRTSDSDRRKGGRRKTVRRVEDRLRETSASRSDRQLQSLLELGRLIGLDLNLEEMLLQMARKAAEVMEADRCSIFLYDPKTEELWSMVAMGLGGGVIRVPAEEGLSGACFQTGQTLRLEDAYKDPRFNKAVDAQTGYRTRSVLCMPLSNRAHEIIGVIELLNKRDGVFDPDDEVFLRAFGNHASVFIEIAQLQKARVEALEESREGLRRLNRAKDKALNHLSHEMKTPLSIIQGNLKLLKRKFQASSEPADRDVSFEPLEKNLDRLLRIQQEADEIIRSYQRLDEERPLEDLGGKPLEKERKSFLPNQPSPRKAVRLLSCAEKMLQEVKQKARHRQIRFFLEGRKDVRAITDPHILEEILEGLLKNAVENTPDGGIIRILLEGEGPRVLLKVQDFGVGITEENQKNIFDGLFTTRDMDLYSSKRPYDFGAGGKGLDLLRMKVYGQRFGFDCTVESRRCLYLPTDRDLCLGKISSCPYAQKLEHCLASGGSTFSVSFPAARGGDL